MRIRLRGHRLEDYPTISAMWADPVVVQHICGGPQTASESWNRLLRYVGHGEGYALEAMRAAFGWMDARAKRAQCIISSENHASQKLATKLGFVPLA
jgi:RimJ/RimL family protein N-acetyltransferase